MSSFIQVIARETGLSLIEARRICYHYSVYADMMFDIDGPADQDIVDIIMNDLDMHILGEILLGTEEQRVLPSFQHSTETAECPVCLTVVDTHIKLPCSHKFCDKCISQWFQTRTTCPMCRADHG
jgi:hypothetical protein